MVGKPLIDPNVIATRFGLQPEIIRTDKAKKQLQAGAGRIQDQSFTRGRFLALKCQLYLTLLKVATAYAVRLSTPSFRVRQ